MTDPTPSRRFRGFERAGRLVEQRVRTAGESRGFAVARVLTHWDEIAGPDVAAIARPVKISYPPSGFGATLTVLTTGARAPMLEMQKEALRARVNACYGYNAVARVRITQTSAHGFAEAQAAFKPAAPPPPEDPTITTRAAEAARDVRDPALRDALEQMARGIMTRGRHKDQAE